jgi:putative ABC transport system permease protein
METLFKDLKYAWRMFLQSRGFTLTAVAAVALGIGANTAIFSVVNTVLLKPLAYPDPDRIVQFLLTSPDGDSPAASPTAFNSWREQANIFQDVSAYGFGGAGLNLAGGAYPEQVQAIHCTVDYFRLFGAQTMLGRSFTTDEDRPHGGHVVVVSDGLWKRRFGGDPKLVGSTISLSGDSYTVIGIMERRFVTDPPADLWIPFQFDPNSADQAHYFLAAARLRPGVTLNQARAQLKITADGFRRKFPDDLGPQESFSAQMMQDFLVRDVRSSLLILFIAVVFVLLIACVNVANLLLIRATDRKREVAIRVALGATRGQIIRQLLTENLALSAAGGVTGLFVGIIGVRILLALNSGNIPRIGVGGSAVSVDWRVLAFTGITSLVTGLLFGLIPAVGISRTDVATSLKENNSRSGTSLRQTNVRSLLVVCEIALALILLVGAGLLIRTFIALRAVNPGFDAHNVLTMNMSLTGSRFEKTAGVAQIAYDGVQRLEQLPGVMVASTTCCMPLDNSFGLPFIVVGRPIGNQLSTGDAGWSTVSPGYFEVFKIPLVGGRFLNTNDRHGGPGVVIINQTMARRFWPDGDPLNDQLRIGKSMGPEYQEPARKIIGIVGDVREAGLDREPEPTMYVPVSQIPDGVTALNGRLVPMAWVIRTRVAPQSIRAAIENELRHASGGLPVINVRSMDEIVVRSTARTDFTMLLLTIFGCTALLLSAIGIYGVMAYSIQLRTTELGIRMALGADKRSLRNMVVFQGLRFALIGMVIGMAAAFGLARLLVSFLFGIKTWDPVTFAIAPIVLGAVALLAVWLPGRRTADIDPVNVLRHE